LSNPFRRVLDTIPAPFITPIYDHASPAMTAGRVAMVGDAAFVARPHIGAGVTKAAEDAQSLAEALEDAATVTEGLSIFDIDRCAKNRMAYERGQYLGEYLRLQYTNEAERAEWQMKHNLETIMRDTAVLNFY
jgi:2-polyprenyl-6-methoxyphenol hydroxylase-like FAD-dependent oxidoreductase